MNAQRWIFTVRYKSRCAVVGTANSSTVEAALHLAEIPESVRAEIRACALVRLFVEGRVDPVGMAASGGDSSGFWIICIGSVQAILS